MTSITSLVNLPRTVLGSLTSTFTPPASCSYLGVLYVGDDLVGWQGQVSRLIQLYVTQAGISLLTMATPGMRKRRLATR